MPEEQHNKPLNSRGVRHTLGNLTEQLESLRKQHKALLDYAKVAFPDEDWSEYEVVPTSTGKMMDVITDLLKEAGGRMNEEELLKRVEHSAAGHTKDPSRRISDARRAIAKMIKPPHHAAPKLKRQGTLLVLL